MDLRTAIEAARVRRGGGPPPEFSSDGGVDVFDGWGRSARLQPLGRRIRITLADHGRFVAEGEVGDDALVARIDAGGSTYEAVAGALNAENGPGHRSG